MSHSPDLSDRRRFLKNTSALMALGTAGVTLLGNPNRVHAEGSDVLKFAIIGCGGRGTGAVGDAAQADKNAKLVAIADLFPDRVSSAKEHFKARLGEQF